MKQVTKKEFYDKLMSETKDVISGDCTHPSSEYYPYTKDLKYRHGGAIFGKYIEFGYVQGQPKTEFYLNN